MLGHDVAVLGADGAGALDELQFAHAQHVGAHHPGGARPARDTDDEDDHPVVLAPGGREDHGQRQPGDDQESIGETHPHLCLPASVEAGGDTDAGANHGRHDGGQKTDHERDARTPDELRKDRLAYLVGAEQVVVIPCRRMKRQIEMSGGVFDLRVGIEERVVDEERRQQSHEHEHHEDAKAEHALPVRPVEPPDLVGVPRRQLGALGVTGGPEPGAQAPEHHDHGLEEPAVADDVLAGGPAGDAAAGQERPHGEDDPDEDERQVEVACLAPAHEAESAGTGGHDGAQDERPGRIRGDGRREEPLEYLRDAHGERHRLGIREQFERDPCDRCPEEDPVSEAAGDHAFTLGSR